MFINQTGNWKDLFCAIKIPKQRACKKAKFHRQSLVKNGRTSESGYELSFDRSSQVLAFQILAVSSRLERRLSAEMHSKAKDGERETRRSIQKHQRTTKSGWRRRRRIYGYANVIFNDASLQDDLSKKSQDNVKIGGFYRPSHSRPILTPGIQICSQKWSQINISIGYSYISQVKILYKVKFSKLEICHSDCRFKILARNCVKKVLLFSKFWLEHSQN